MSENRITGVGPRNNDVLSRLLVLDLETDIPEPGQAPSVHMVGAVRTDTGAELEKRINRSTTLSSVLDELDTMADGADWVLGHNLLQHDLPVLRELRPELKLLSLPVIDTLYLSPLAFPRNPYHRLIKDYKLVASSRTSPLADCRATVELLKDQQEAFKQLGESRNDELLCYQALIGTGSAAGARDFLATISGQPAPPPETLPDRITGLLKETDPEWSRDLKVCRTRLGQLLDEELQNEENHWPIAYTLAWLRVSGGNSVLAPWVFHQFPDTGRLVRELRDTPCGRSGCQYCQTTHDPRKELRRLFGFEDFRTNLQHDTVLAGMRGEHVMAVLPTGGGKSLCYQLPALNRYQRNGSLTIIISPLQSLMKDQVDGLLEHNVECAVALNGMLSMPERADAVDKIQMGDAGIVLVSPEQFRNRGFRSVIAQRQIGAWIFDEAHCLSKWGNDFRPDYLYVARFIREFTGDNPLAPIGCFTATAKPDVLDDIRDHFVEELDVGFRSFLATPERSNLSFEVWPCQQAEKRARTLELIDDDLGERDGGAVVFVSSRKKSEELASFIASQDWACHHYHAGLDPNEKKDIQDAFKSGELRVIVATNAFGMGVDKADIRLVVHAEIPGSLENYLQEAGRAGRDQQDARCVLLYDPRDVENQFGLSARSQLTRRDIEQILSKLRLEGRKRDGDPLVITAGEILQDEQVDTTFDPEDRDAETKVNTAVAWLERGGYLKREVNVTQIFPASLDLSEERVKEKLSEAGLTERRRQQFSVILSYLRSAKPDERISTDQLVQVSGMTRDEVISALRQMEQLGLLTNDQQITLYLRHGVADASKDRLQQALTLEEHLFPLLAELAPDAEGGDWQDVTLGKLNTRLSAETGLSETHPAQLLQLLKSLSRDAADKSQRKNSFDLRTVGHDRFMLRVAGGLTWREVHRLGEKRRMVAAVLFGFLSGKVPTGTRSKDVLVETTFGELERVIADDMESSSRVPVTERRRAVEHVLLYLHQQRVLVLNHGMTVMRRAMTIEVNPDKTGRYRKDDFQRLDEHYRERLIQVHVMQAYAKMGCDEMAKALQLVMDYFSLDKVGFLQRYFRGKERNLELATSEGSWRSIVKALNTEQQRIVEDKSDQNRLVLAGPGSGKTRVIVHRIAFLVRVRRVPATAIVALTFNRHAANEIRQRLYALVGQDAFGVTVLTYHAMAMRLTGFQFERKDVVDEQSLQDVLHRAVDLLEGADRPEGEDELRDQLLGGYRYILVDEYQDIDELQYRLVSALAGRHVNAEKKLCILGVGDDDQNIYAWRNTSNQYIDRFCDEYEASLEYLVENYRSTSYIIEAANYLIQSNQDRMKQAHPIRVDRGRKYDPPGGAWESHGQAYSGKVLRILIDSRDRGDGNLQAQAAVARLQTLMKLAEVDWSDCAVLARGHQYLHPIQAWCEQNSVPYHLAADKSRAVSLTRYREFLQVVAALESHDGRIAVRQDFQFSDSQDLDLPWMELFDKAAQQLHLEFGDVDLGAGVIIDWLYDYFREIRRSPGKGLYIGTVHSAKGLEFPHVVLLDGGWRSELHANDEERRLYYVGMTRAAQTLALCEFEGGNPFSTPLEHLAAKMEFHGEHHATLGKRYHVLGLNEIDIGFAGRQPDSAAIHRHIANLRGNCPLTWRESGGRYEFLDINGNVVGRTASAFRLQGSIEESTVSAIVVRYQSDAEEQYKKLCKTTQWEVVVPRLTLQSK